MAPAPGPVTRLRYRRTTRWRVARLLVAMGGILILLAGVALCIGPGTFAIGSVLGEESTTIIFSLRLPRIVLAVAVGGALSATGVLFQAMLRNPLAEPYMLGVSNGCAVGAMLGYAIGSSMITVPLLSFAGGALVVVAVLWISKGGGYGDRSEGLLLGGVMVAAIGAALIFLLLGFLGDSMRTAIQWMMGNLASASAQIGYGSGLLWVLVLGASLVGGNILNAISLGDDEAAALGVPVDRARTVLYLLGSLTVGLTVSFCGAIGFVGLVAPHIMRRIVGPDHRMLLPASVVGGGIFLLLCDTAARSLMGFAGNVGSELPVGAVTALVGAPIFITMLRNAHRRLG